MKKKVIDIFPPKEKKEDVCFSGKESSIEERPVIKKALGEREKKWFFNKKKILLGLSLCFLLAVFFLPLFFEKAEIIISPKTEKLNFTKKIIVDATKENSDFSEGILRGEILMKEQVFIDEFQASGKKLTRAEGILRLYNAYTTQNEVWRKGTRFVSSEGKLFLSKGKIHIPGATMKNKKIIPSYVDVPVVAAEGGESYNIGPSKFSVFVYRGTPRYTKFYGESFKPMKGGGEVSQVTAEDLKEARKALEEKAKQEAPSLFKEASGLGYKVLKDGIKIEILEEKSEAKEGDEKEKFNFQIKARLLTLVFREKEADNFIFSLLSQKVPSSKIIDERTLEKEYKAEFFNPETKRLSLFLLFSIKTYNRFQSEYLKKALAGKKIKEAKIFLDSIDGINQAKVKIFPFWLRKLPGDIEKINIKVEPKID